MYMDGNVYEQSAVVLRRLRSVFSLGSYRPADLDTLSTLTLNSMTNFGSTCHCLTVNEPSNPPQERAPTVSWKGSTVVYALSDGLSEEVTVLVAQHSQFLELMTACVEKYLNQCGRRWVEMSNLFSFMKI